MFKTILKKINFISAKYLGYKITRAQRNKEMSNEDFLSAYRAAVLTNLSYQKTIRIVIVGANDGCLSDPIYDFNKSFRDRTEVLLIEPQTLIIPYLKKNYSFHPKHYIHNGAVGPEGKLTLFSINPAYWKYLRTPAHALGWPEYGAPTGITSTNREHVIKYLQLLITDSSLIDKAILELNIKSTPLLTILKEFDLSSNIDVLQIDVEGFDDEVIYNSNIEIIKPRIIFFEAQSLSKEKFDKVEEYLKLNGYIIYRLKYDAIAFLTTTK